MAERTQVRSPAVEGGIGNLKAELQQLKRRRVLDEARVLFWRYGYSTTTFSHIARGLSVTKPFLYSLFDSKAELLAHVCLATARDINEQVAAVETARSPEADLRATIETLSVVTCRNYQGVGITLTEGKNLDAGSRATLAHLQQDTLKKLTARVARRLGASELSGDGELIALALFGMVQWIHNWLNPDGRASPAQIAAAFGEFGSRACGHALPGRPAVAPPGPPLHPAQPPSRLGDEAGNPAEQDRILAEATRLFHEHGYEQTTLDQLAHSLGVAKPRLYEHFPSKQSILDEACLRGARLAYDGIARIRRSGGTAADALVAAVDGLLLIVISHRPHVTLAFRERRRLPPAIVDQIRHLNSGFDAVLRDIITEGCLKGEFDVPDIGLAALAIAGAVCWVYTWYEDEGPGPEGRLRVEMAAFALRVVAAGPPAPAAAG